MKSQQNEDEFRKHHYLDTLSRGIFFDCYYNFNSLKVGIFITLKPERTFELFLNEERQKNSR